MKDDPDQSGIECDDALVPHFPAAIKEAHAPGHP
jgi:hypothetical protein